MRIDALWADEKKITGNSNNANRRSQMHSPVDASASASAVASSSKSHHHAGKKVGNGSPGKVVKRSPVKANHALNSSERFGKGGKEVREGGREEGNCGDDVGFLKDEY